MCVKLPTLECVRKLGNGSGLVYAGSRGTKLPKNDPSDFPALRAFCTKGKGGGGGLSSAGIDGAAGEDDPLFWTRAAADVVGQVAFPEPHRTAAGVKKRSGRE